MESFDRYAPLPQKMAEKSLCFPCAFWMDKIENPPQHSAVIGGSYYIFDSLHVAPLSARKFDRGMFFIMFNDMSFLVCAHVWISGIVPERFREQLPDNAQFISQQTFVRLRKNPFFCKSKGCWDRYACFRYDVNLEKDGPWNKIPKDYVIGGEECGSFINKKLI
jgi:hypothetical protein